MPKALCYAGLAVAAVTLIIFLCDLLVQIPFGRENAMMDVVFVLTSATLGYLALSSARELNR